MALVPYIAQQPTQQSPQKTTAPSRYQGHEYVAIVSDITPCATIHTNMYSRSSPGPEVLLAYSTYLHHSMQLSREAQKVAKCTQALLTKSGLDFELFSRISPDPGSCSRFKSPNSYDMEALSKQYKLQSNLIDPEAAESAINRMGSFIVRIEQRERDVFSDGILISQLRYGDDGPCCWMPFVMRYRLVAAGERLEMVGKWVKLDERGEELRIWVEEAAALVKIAEELLNSGDPPIDGKRGLDGAIRKIWRWSFGGGKEKIA